MIPKKIHYCWFGPKPFPKLVRKCIASWKVNLPDYEFTFWNETNSPMNVPYVNEAYKTKQYVFVSDYVRFFALYNDGGIYLDMDMFVLRSFNKLLDNSCFFAWETAEKQHISCGVIGSETNNGLIGKIMDEYNALTFSKVDIVRLVSPRIITPIFKKYEEQEKIQILPYDYFYPFPYKDKENVRNFLQYKTEDSYAIHLWNKSWSSSLAKITDLFYYYLRKIRG